VDRALDTGLIHVSNLFRTHPVEELARRLTSVSGLDRAFFCNSGAEAVEGALKFAKKWAKSVGGPEKHRIVAFQGGFHGRLHGSLAVTARPDYQRPFEPLMPGVDFVDPTDLAALDAALSAERTAALILEPIQGEGGVRVLEPALLRKAREWTAERGIALIFDEIQCGLGRTGRLFAFEEVGVTPDLLCLAKPLAGGLPMGAVLLRESIGEVVAPGDHGTTFGGGPLVSTVALAVLEIVADPAFLSEVSRKGALLASLLEELRTKHPDTIREVRGAGLIRGVELAEGAAPVVAKARELGLLTVPAGTQVIRLLPPLTVTDDEIRRAVGLLGEAL
jgi:acetylornithine/succinyldiaminopimelate/putrescine aminotransferase